MAAPCTRRRARLASCLAAAGERPTIGAISPWTVAKLARRIGLSRTRFADRFRHFLGESPIAYLAQWRLRLGAEILQSTEDSVAEVAAAVGYGSEAGFNRAFKREFDCPPAEFRRKRKAPPAQHSQPDG
ncbi:MAG: helix-turn-helix transcriptional regulator [Pyrinomonadaceae bacterium]